MGKSNIMYVVQIFLSRHIRQDYNLIGLDLNMDMCRKTVFYTSIDDLDVRLKAGCYTKKHSFKPPQ